MKKLRIAFWLNVLLVALEVFATLWMMSGIGDDGVLSSAGLAMLKFFTVDSNIFMGIVALVVAIDEWRVLKGVKDEVSKASLVLKLLGTVSVTLTMLVTVFFLTPTTYETRGLFALFHNSNFFMHLLNPLLAIVVFVVFEKTDKLGFKLTFAGIVPMLVYAAYYVFEAVTHSHDGIVDAGYDWYHFFFAGLQSIVIVVPVILLLTYGISAALWRANKKR